MTGQIDMAVNWPQILIALAIGMLIGAVIMRFGSSKLRRQETLKKELEQAKVELEQHRQELVSHFAHSAELLDTMAQDFRKLYQHMAKDSSTLLPDMMAKESAIQYKAQNDHLDLGLPVVEVPPRDYSDRASGLLRTESKEQ